MIRIEIKGDELRERFPMANAEQVEAAALDMVHAQIGLSAALWDGEEDTGLERLNQATETLNRSLGEPR